MTLVARSFPRVSLIAWVKARKTCKHQVSPSIHCHKSSRGKKLSRQQKRNIRLTDICCKRNSDRILEFQVAVSSGRFCYHAHYLWSTVEETRSRCKNCFWDICLRSFVFKPYHIRTLITSDGQGEGQIYFMDLPIRTFHCQRYSRVLSMMRGHHCFSTQGHLACQLSNYAVASHDRFDLLPSLNENTKFDEDRLYSMHDIQFMIPIPTCLRPFQQWRRMWTVTFQP